MSAKVIFTLLKLQNLALIEVIASLLRESENPNQNKLARQNSFCFFLVKWKREVKVAVKNNDSVGNCLGNFQVILEEDNLSLIFADFDIFYSNIGSFFAAPMLHKSFGKTRGGKIDSSIMAQKAFFSIDM